MAGEVQANGPGTGRQTYFLTRNSTSGSIWNGLSGNFQIYNSALYAGFPVSMTEQGGASNYYVGNFPSAIPPGVYNVTAKQQIGGSPAEADPTFAFGDLQWNGSGVVPLSDLVTSGQFSTIGPIKAAKGNAINPFCFTLVSSADHLSPFVSGIVSGQIQRDNGAFTGLQSGIFTEIGQGFYTVGLTSGDLNGNSIGLSFSALGVSGGASDVRNFTFVMQKGA